MPGTGSPVPAADVVLACPLTFNSVNKFAHGHADNFALGLLCEMVGYGVPVVVVPHCKPQLASHPAFGASLETLRGMGIRVLFDPDAPYERRLPPGPLDGGEETEREVSLAFLHAQARSAYQAYQATRYDAVGRILPGLIRGVETAARTAGSASPAACAVRARVYDTTAALLSRVGEPFLAWAAADRAMFAAEQSDDPTRDVLTELLRREHRPSTPELRPLARRAGVI
jgi:hypothetical protein